MRRTQIQLDEQTYQLARRRAYQQGKSLSAVVRETLAEALGRAPAPRLALKDFRSVGIGRSRQGSLAPVSERHDDALVAAVAGKTRRSR